MVARTIGFDIEKGLEAIVLIASKLEAEGIEADAHSVAKLLYWADKWHLEHYGSQVTGDEYIAMPEGPVPSNVYEIIKSARGESFFEYPNEVSAMLAGAFAVENKYIIHPKRAPNLAKLSESEIQALTESITKYGRLTYDERRRASHGPAWKSAKRNTPISLEAIIEELPNKEEVLSYIKSR